MLLVFSEMTLYVIFGRYWISTVGYLKFIFHSKKLLRVQSKKLGLGVRLLGFKVCFAVL